MNNYSTLSFYIVKKAALIAVALSVSIALIISTFWSANGSYFVVICALLSLGFGYIAIVVIVTLEGKSGEKNTSVKASALFLSGLNELYAGELDSGRVRNFATKCGFKNDYTATYFIENLLEYRTTDDFINSMSDKDLDRIIYNYYENER